MVPSSWWSMSYPFYTRANANKQGMIFQRLFEIDYGIYTGEYRIIDDYLPVELALEAAQQKNANKAKGTGHSLEGNQVAAKSADWSLNVAIHKVCWNNNNGLGRAGWAASGSASGIGRVDIIRGRFINGRTPAGLGP
jgi:transcription factor C subunit 6